MGPGSRTPESQLWQSGASLQVMHLERKDPGQGTVRLSPHTHVWLVLTGPSELNASILELRPLSAQRGGVACPCCTCGEQIHHSENKMCPLFVFCHPILDS